MKKIIDSILTNIKKVPWYGWAASVFFILLQWAFYETSFAIIKAYAVTPTGLNPSEFAPLPNIWCIEPYITGIDDKIPIVPYFFSEIYYFSFLFWFFAPAVVSVTKKEHFLEYCIGFTIALALGCVIHASVPTYIDRYNVAGVTGNNVIEYVKNMKFKGLSWFLMNFMYNKNGGQFSWRAFPSYHCLLSVYAWLGIRKQKEVGLGMKIYTIVMILLIFLSTLFTRQHYIIDMFASIILGTLVFFIVALFKPGEKMVKRWPNILKLNFKHKKQVKNRKSFEQ